MGIMDQWTQYMPGGGLDLGAIGGPLPDGGEIPGAIQPPAPPMAAPMMAPPPAPSGPIRGTPPAPSQTVPAMEDVRAIRTKNAAAPAGGDASAVEGLRERSGAAGDSRLLRPLLASLGEGGGSLAGHGRFVGGAGDVVDMAGRARTAAALDALFGQQGTPSVDRDPMADRIAADTKGLAWENLQPIGSESSVMIGAPGEPMEEGSDFISDYREAPPLGTQRIGEARAAQAAMSGIGGKSGFKPSDRRALSQDRMTAYYVGQLDKLRTALDSDVADGRRTQEEADSAYSKAERAAAFRMNALGGESTAGFFAKPDPYDLAAAPLPAIGGTK